MERDRLKAVHDDDLAGFLQGIGLYARFARGKLNCGFCRDVITYDNLYAVYPDSGNVKLSCDKPHCVNDLLRRIEERRA